MSTAIGLTIGSGSIVAGAATAVAGAVGLGFLGVASIFRRRSRSRSKHRPTGGYGRRRRRAAKNKKNVAIGNSLRLIRQEDVTGCGLKFMCELAKRDPTGLTVEELSVLNLVGPVVRPGEGLLPDRAIDDYRRAKALGQGGGSCSEAYPLCAFSGSQLMETVSGFLP
ncbi:uncharacterized protein LOC135221407 [Macrobrachium nipponense]|uniref:uncharacterized protein LOC135221407 n=1 Tax=Macrobrachium nipponense TaxID=159736 RepID=UPI0030C7FB5F